MSFLKTISGFVFGSCLALGFVGCSSKPEVKSQAYAELRQKWTFEDSFADVWKGIEATVRNYKIVERDPTKVSSKDERTLKERTIRTDWVVGQSRDKYIEFRVNDLPKKQYLQTRVRFTVIAARVIGGVEVSVESQEQVERLNGDGSSAGWQGVEQVDTSRTNELIEKIKFSVLTAEE